jgi:hypothetical protein
MSALLPPSSGLKSKTEGKGELDFYISGSLKWGIELVSDGKNLPEHINRFKQGGSSFAPNISDYRMVDFRSDTSKKRKSKGIDKHEVQVRFTAQFAGAELCFGSTQKTAKVKFGSPTRMAV